FLMARFFKTRVDKFYLFFNPYFSLFKLKKGETEYGIGWLPLGGYVKIAGMIDESIDKKQLENAPKPDEFRSKKAWQRLLIILAGVMVNFVLAFLIYVGVSYKWGETYLPNDNLKHGIVVDSLAYDLGLRNGDKILKIDDQKPDDFAKMLQNLVLNSPKTITVARPFYQYKQGVNPKVLDVFVVYDTLSIPIKESFRKEILSASSKSFKHRPFMQPRVSFAPFFIKEVSKGSPAEKAGLQPNDQVLAIDGNAFDFYDEFQNYLKTKINNTVTLKIARNSEILTTKLTLKDTPLLGVYVDGTKQEKLALAHNSFSLFESVEQGGAKLQQAIDGQISSLKLLFTKEGANAVGGIGSMAQIFPTYWSWQVFWQITAMLSIMFAFLNV
ncbi:MAG: site-2 protease family protein, partial [Flavobacteriaceae bacterium]|nr:site-2 protease family protein [Flavobacteriaceae bacterium]